MTKQSQAGVWVWVGVGLVALSAACGVLGYRLWAGFAEVRDAWTPESPHFGLQAAVNGHVEFLLTYDPAAQGVSTLTVLDAADTALWQIDGQGVGRVAVVEYGTLPVEPGVRWTQRVPADGPPPAVRGRKVKVVVTGKYSGPLGVGPQTVELTFVVAE